MKTDLGRSHRLLTDGLCLWPVRSWTETRWHSQQILIAHPTGKLLSKGINASQNEQSQIWGQLADLASHSHSHDETAGLGDRSALSASYSVKERCC